MKNTRFMEVMFSNTNEELANQVDNDIKKAQTHGEVDTDEVKYENLGDGNVAITDKENGEVTLAQKAHDVEDTYDLVAVPDGNLERFLHLAADGVHKGSAMGAPDEDIKNHFNQGDVISPNLEDGGLNPDAGFEDTIEERYQDEQKQFSVYSDNVAVQRIFADQEFCERVFSEVIESEETAKVGDLKIEKLPDVMGVVVTSESTGDQAKVEFDGEDMNVTELDSKNFSGGQFEALHVVGVDPIDHVLIDAPEYSQESAEELVKQLTEDGVDGVRIFDNAEDARDYAFELLNGLGVNSPEDVEEPEQVEYSDHEVYLTKFYADHNNFTMLKMFSEEINGVSDIKESVEDAISNGDQIETDEEVIIPVDAVSAVIQDKESDEFTKATVAGEDLRLEDIEEDEAHELISDLHVEDEDEGDDGEDEDDEDEKEFSDVYCDEAETRFFSEYEEVTDYMQRLFSEESDQEDIEDAIEDGEQVETDTEIITPVDAKTAVVEDKESGEFTKATIEDEDSIDVHPISEEEANELTENIHVESDEEEDEKKFSDTLEKFFAEAVTGTAPAALPAPAPNQPVTAEAVVDPNAAQPQVQQGEVVEEDQAQSVEEVEDKAMAIAQNIKAAGEEAAAMIMNAKAAPAPNAEPDLQEAQFSERTFSQGGDTLISWLYNK